jgi:hypothetical protein
MFYQQCRAWQYLRIFHPSVLQCQADIPYLCDYATSDSDIRTQHMTREVYSFEYTEIPEALLTPHHVLWRQWNNQ